MQRFLGLADFQTTAPLIVLTSTQVTFRWSEHAQGALTNLKSCFTSAPVLSVPDPKLQFIVDAYELRVRTVLSQRSPQDGNVHPCAYFSHHLSPAERNYEVGDRELLTVRLTLDKWRHWLEGVAEPFLVWKDHKNIEYIRSEVKLSADKVGPLQFRFTLSYRPVQE